MTGRNSETCVTQNDADRLGCTDYRKFRFARLIFIDSDWVENGASWQFKLVMFLSVVTQIFCFVSIYAAPDARVMLDCLRSTLLGLVVNLGLASQYFSRHRIAQLHAFLDKAMSRIRTDLPEERGILLKGKKDAKAVLDFFSKMFIANGLAMTFAQPLQETLFGKSWKKLPMPWAFPPTDTDLNFSLVLAFQIVAVIIANCTGMAIMSFIAITIQMDALFDVIVLTLKNIEGRAAARSRLEGISLRRAMTECLREDTKCYIELTRELRSISPYFRDTFSIASSGLPLILACEAFPFMSGGLLIGDMMKSFVFLSLQLICWAQLCSRFETLTDKHFAVFNGLYDTPWYEADIEYRNLVLTTLTFATHPKYIRTRFLNEVTANMATFYSFVMSAFNLLNMLRKIS